MAHGGKHLIFTTYRHCTSSKRWKTEFFERIHGGC